MSNTIELIKELMPEVEATIDNDAVFESGRDMLEALIKDGTLREVCYSHELNDSLLSMLGDCYVYSEGLFEEVCERIVMEREHEERVKKQSALLPT